MGTLSVQRLRQRGVRPDARLPQMWSPFPGCGCGSTWSSSPPLRDHTEQQSLPVLERHDSVNMRELTSRTKHLPTDTRPIQPQRSTFAPRLQSRRHLRGAP